MKKIKSVKSSNVIISYLLKVVISSILSLALITLAFSVAAVKLDWGQEAADIITVIISFLCAVIVGLLSLTGVKNNLVVLGILSELPLVFYSLVNLVFYENSVAYFAIKTCLMLLTGAVCGIIRTKRAKRFKI